MLLSVGFSGCRSTRENLRHWWQNDLMVGPSYCEPAVPFAEAYRDSQHERVDSSNTIGPRWWSVFNDSDLDLLMDTAYRQNLTLKAASWRIEESRALRNIAAANLFPQSQQLSGQYAHTQNSSNLATAFPGFPVTVDDWLFSFDASWEVDVWGRIRRSVDAADASMEASIKDYDFAMVTLFADIATLYIQIRSLDERIVLAKANEKLFEESLKIAKIQLEAEATSSLEVLQAKSNLAQTQALIPQLELGRRQSLNALAVLLAVQPSDIEQLGNEPGTLPKIPAEVIVGIPAQLLTQRPDIRSAERNMRAQFEQIGIAEAELYPQFGINGTLGYQAAKLSDLFSGDSYTGTIAPGFNWKILNYGRLKNGIRVEESRFNQIRFDFENLVLNAQREVEDSIIDFIKRKEQLVFDQQRAEANTEAVDLALFRFDEGVGSFLEVYVLQSDLVSAQDQVVATRANVAIALINTYRALGGGWQVRCETPLN